MIWVVQEYGIIIDIMINCAHHGKCLVDALAGRDKRDLSLGHIDGIESAQKNANGKRILETDKARGFLQDPERDLGLGDTKHKRAKIVSKLTSRNYETTNYESKHDIPLANSSYKIVSGFDTGKPGTPEGRKNGLKEMFHFRFYPLMPENMAVVRRIPCLCAGCKKQLANKWDMNVADPKNQKCF